MRITFDHVSSAYTTRTRATQPALQNICLDVDTTSLIGICGRTGSGKTTLIRHLNGIIKPDTGRIFVDGADIHRSKNSLHALRQRIGMTFQFPERQLFGQTVWEELTYTLERREVPHDQMKHQVLSACALVDFDVHALRHRSPFSLSRGEQRKLSIAVILSLRPELLVLDEPTAGMDRANAFSFLHRLRTLHQTHQAQIILVSHDIELLMHVADDLIILAHGSIAFAGSLPQILTTPHLLRDAGIPLPPIYQVLQLLRQSYPQISLSVQSFDEALQEIITHVPR
ncbi:ATP-binding cassette domain-containing protein [candidate division KSB3 bacterium]|uniref:ATP-binding cassette domain-containing protein n=1 Tax=candidate division KSB3 bacterium TaxID=2044937 RepID=A0A9D5JTB6_9BACT|nr:ATP-binding cassette domain-containing protein [candidate division KSB3 bacterium]MBD3323828.1 ATP-binding cassette domain-containing protein [candidate division KSB3 bacterium]